MDVVGKVVLVTGAGSGIGAEVVRVLAGAGAVVAGVDRDGPAVRAVASDVGAQAHQVDVCDEAGVAAVIEAVVAEHGRLDAAVNNAALAPDSARLEDLDLDRFETIMRVNVGGMAVCLKHELRQMYAQGAGSIVNLGSVRSFRPRVANPAYVASKHAVLGLTRVAALEAAGTTVRINAVCPGAVETPMLAGFLAERGRSVEDFTAEMSLVGRLGRPGDIAAAVRWLCSDASAFVTGAAVPVDGGYTAR